MDPAEKILEKQLRRKEKELEKKNHLSFKYGIEEEINKLLKDKRLKVSDNILEYWENRKANPLYPLAKILLSMPFSETSVEMIFSFLKYLHNDYRTSLSPEMVDAIMFLRSNFHEFYRD